MSETSGATEGASIERKTRREITGVVRSDKMVKTRAVEVVRLVPHAKYGKGIRRRTVFKVHDEDEISHEGDLVRIQATRPISKTKRWRLVEVVRAAKLRGGIQVTGVEDALTPTKSGAAPGGGTEP